MIPLVIVYITGYIAALFINFELLTNEAEISLPSRLLITPIVSIIYPIMLIVFLYQCIKGAKENGKAKTLEALIEQFCASWARSNRRPDMGDVTIRKCLPESLLEQSEK